MQTGLEILIYNDINLALLSIGHYYRIIQIQMQHWIGTCKILVGVQYLVS